MKTSSAVIVLGFLAGSASAFTPPTLATRAVGTKVVNKKKTKVPIATKAIKKIVKKPASKPVKKSAPKKKLAPAAFKASSGGVSPYANELGVIAPTGFWDPCYLSDKIDQATFDKYRAAELKHGRVAMLAVCGYVAPEIWRWGGDLATGLKFADVPNGLAAIPVVPFFGWLQILAAVGIVENTGFLGDFEIGKLPGTDAQYLERRKLAELQHGRIAMLAILELFRHDSQNLVQPGFDGYDNLITGLPFLYN